MCTPPDGACIQPDCGWRRRELAGQVLLFPARAALPTASTELDALLELGGLAGEGLARAHADLRLALSRELVLAADLDVDGRSSSASSLRHESASMRVVWTPPPGSNTSHVGLELGARVGRDVLASGGGRLASLGRSTSAEALSPGLVLGASGVRTVPRWAGGLGHVSGSFQVMLQGDGADGVETGWRATAAWGASVLGHATPGWMLAVEVEQRPDWPLQGALPIGVYGAASRRALLGIEVAPMLVRQDQAWGSGLRIGVRIGAFGEPQEWRESLGR